MLRRVIWSMISLLFIAYVGENAGLSLVGPAFAQTGSGSGSQTTASVGSCPVWLEGDNSALYIATPPVRSVAPTSGSLARGTVLIVTGANLRGAIPVTCGGAAPAGVADN